MSFYTIETPGNREDEVKKYLKLREYLRARDSIDKTGHYERKKELLKTYKPLLKPITEPLKDIKTKVETLPQDIGKMTGEEFNKALAALPTTNIFNQMPQIEQVEQVEQVEQSEPIEEGKIKINITGDKEQDEILTEIQNKTERDFFRFEKGEFFIGDERATIKPKSNELNYKGMNYNLSPELLNLLLITGETKVKSRYLNPKYFNNLDKIKTEINEDGTTENYAINAYRKILSDSGLLFYRTPKGGIRPSDKLVKNKVWDKILKPVYDKYAKEERRRQKSEPKASSSGKGIKTTKNNTVFLSSNPDALADRLTLLCASQKAGNTGVNNEIIDICNELIRMQAMTRKQKNKILKEYKP